MMLRPTNDQPFSKKPTTWDALAQGTSFAGRVNSEHPFAHALGCQVASRSASGLGTLKHGP